jgi:RecB family exonuclease
MQWIAGIRTEFLETALLGELDRLHSEDVWRPVEVLTPTAILAEHLGQRLSRDRSRLGVQVRTLHAFAHSRLSAAGITTRILPRHARLDLLRLSGDGLRNNIWVEHAGRRSGTASAILQRIDELREAGISPGQAAAETRSNAESAFADWYSAYLGQLEKQAPAHTDEAGLIELCIQAIEADPPEATILMYGAYEFVGSAVDLLTALDRVRRVTMFLPFDPLSEASRTTRERLARSFGVEPLFEETQAAPDISEPAGIARVLFDSETPPTDDDSAEVLSVLSLRNANGSAHEIDAAIRSTERWIEGGVPAHRILWVTRDPGTLFESLADRWAPWIEGDAQSAFSSSHEQPLLSNFRVAVWWRLLETVAADFPRVETIALLSDPRPLAMREELFILDADVQHLDRLSRERSIFGGAAEFRAQRNRSRALPGRDLQAWELADRFCVFWKEFFDDGRKAPVRKHLERIVTAFRHLFPEPEANEAAVRLTELAEELAQYELWRPQPVAWKTSLNRLRSVLTESGLPNHTVAGNRVRVLEARQARGIPTQHTIVLGMQAGGFPKNPATDGILDESYRERLRQKCSRPLAGSEETAEEEKTLFAALLSGAGESVTLSWQREDDKGGVLLPSPWIGRLRRTFGSRLPVDSIPTHPAARLQHAVTQGEPILSREQWCLRALATADPQELLGAASNRSDLQPGLQRLAEIESFTATTGRFDARLTPPPALPDTWSVSRIGSLAGCPLRWWGEEVLGVSSLEAEPDRVNPPATHIGNGVHQALQELYQTLFEKGLLWKSAACEAAREILPGILARAFTGAGIGDRHLAPGLGPLLRSRWEQAILDRLDSDLERRAGEIPQKFVAESSVERSLAFGDQRTVTVRARFDLEEERATGEREIVDYKTSKTVDKHINKPMIARLEKTQAALYSRLSNNAAVVFFPVYPGLEPDERKAQQYKPELTDDCLNDLGRVFDVIEQGRFPWLNDDDKRCGDYCAIRDACRRGHPPTLAREQESGDRDRVEGWSKRNYKDGVS